MSARTVQLGEIATIERRAATDAECANLPFVGLEHVESGSGNFTVEFKRRPEPMLATKFRFGAEHVLYGKLRPYLNKVVLPDFDGVCTTEILPILPKPDAIDRRFLYALLLSPYFVHWASLRVSGANLPRLDPGMLEEFSFDLPSLPEQERIARLLGHADRLRRTRRYTLELSDTFPFSAFEYVFGDPMFPRRGQHVERLENVLAGDPQNGLYVPAQRYVSKVEQRGVEMVHMSDLFGGIVATGNLKRVQVEQSEINKYGLNEQDILVARRSLVYDGAAKPCRIPPLRAPLVFESSMIRIRPNAEKLLTVYLYYYLSHEAVRRGRVRRFVTISTISGINQDGLGRIEVVVPQLTLQEAFANMIGPHERLREIQLEELRQADHLFQSLLHRTFH